MSTFDIFLFSIIVSLIFLFPFGLLKIISWLKKKIEPAINNSEWGEAKKLDYNTLKDDVRSSAIFYIFISVVCVFMTLGIEFDDGGFYSLGASMVFLFGGIGIWRRRIWAPWVASFPLVLFAFYLLLTEVNELQWIYVFVFSIWVSNSIMGSIRKIKIYEVMS